MDSVTKWNLSISNWKKKKILDNHKNNLENGSFRNRENLQYKKTADWV